MKHLKPVHPMSEFSSSGDFIDEVQQGEIFHMETLDCYGGVIQTHLDLRSQATISCMNPATGPVRIAEIKAGDILEVEVLEIALGSQGVMGMREGFGPLGDMVEFEDMKILPVQENKIFFNERIILEATPMIGVLGVLPEDGEIGTPWPGDHGGNLDTKEIQAGSKVYLKAFQDGGGLAIGDLHAKMGDGEMGGSGVEIGGMATLRVQKKELPFDLNNPLVVLGDHAYWIASAKTFDEAVKRGVKELVTVLEETQSLSFNDAYRLLSLIGDLQISQVVNPLITIKIRVPKSFLGL